MLKAIIYFWLIFVFFVCSSFSQVSIYGTVSDSASSNPIQGVIVSISSGKYTTISDSVGYYSLGTTTNIRQDNERGNNFLEKIKVNLNTNRVQYFVDYDNTPVAIEIYNLSGKLVKSVLNQLFNKGKYETTIIYPDASLQVYLLKIKIGSICNVIKIYKTRMNEILLENSNKSYKLNNGGFNKKEVVVDTILAWAVGYNVLRLPIENLTGKYDIKLSKAIPYGSAMVIQTSQAGDRLAIKPYLSFANDDGASMATITIDSSTTYQTIVGFGCAFTETSVYNLTKVGSEKCKNMLNDLFNPFSGVGFTLMRTHINSCDFCLASYSYDDTPGDYNLEKFDISHEKKWMIPRISEALAVPGANFLLFASPWAPPAWMKTTNEMLHGGELKPDCYNSWALYYVKYIEEMEKNGIPIWGITIQNEPEFSPPWEGCRYTAAQMRDFLKNYLGPTFKKYNRDEKIMVFDHNKDHVADWAQTIFSDTAAAKYAWGTAYHWYSGDQFENLASAHNMFPQKQLIGSENSLGEGDYKVYSSAEKIGHSIIGDINNWSNGFLTWNLVTDINSFGPSHAGTRCIAPIMIDSVSLRVETQLEYYFLGHFSKYVRPQAKRIKCTSTNSSLETTAFKNTNGTIVVVVLNRTTNAIQCKIKNGTSCIKPTIEAHSIVNFIF
jgi:glucosylceramidase